MKWEHETEINKALLNKPTEINGSRGAKLGMVFKLWCYITNTWDKNTESISTDNLPYKRH